MEEDDNTPPQSTITSSTYLPPFLATCDHIIQQTAGKQTGKYYQQRAAYIKEHYTIHKSTHSKVTLSTICEAHHKSKSAISNAKNTLVYEPTLRSMMEDKCYLWEIAWVLDITDYAVRNGIKVYLNNCGEGKLFDSIDADIAELYSERSHTYKKKKYESKGPPKAFIEDQVLQQISEGKDNSKIKVPGVLYYKLKDLIKILRQSYDDAALTAAVPLTEATPHTIALYIQNLFREKDRSKGSYMQNPEAFKEMDTAYGVFLITRLDKKQHSWTAFSRHMKTTGIWDRLTSKNFTREQMRSHFYTHLEIPCDIDPSLPVISRSTVKDIVQTKFSDQAESDIGKIIKSLIADYPKQQLYAGIKVDINNILESAKRSAAQSGTEGEERGEPQAKKATINRNSDDSSQQTLSPVLTENTSLSQLGLNDATDNVSPMPLENHLESAKRSIYNSPSACLAAKSKTADEED